jgi:cysteine synthase A
MAANATLTRIGPTPLAAIQLDEESPTVYAKLEFLNPSGSIKDRIASFILSKALRCGALAPGGLVVEASSGSTSIAMALTCAQLGLRFVAIMPEGVSQERILMISAYGAEIELTPAEAGIAGANARAAERSAREAAFWPQQFTNPDNAEAHRRWTAHELVDQVPGGRVDAVVAGVGTGGTLVGLHAGCRDHGCPTVPVLARPVTAGAIGDIECCSFSRRVPGVVEGQSALFDLDMPELEIVEVPDSEALDITRALIRLGFPVGPSSGLNVAAALRIARSDRKRFATVATVFPDRMERYFSTELFRNPDNEGAV